MQMTDLNKIRECLRTIEDMQFEAMQMQEAMLGVAQLLEESEDLDGKQVHCISKAFSRLSEQAIDKLTEQERQFGFLFGKIKAEETEILGRIAGENKQ